LLEKSGLYLDEMVVFLWGEFEVIVAAMSSGIDWFAEEGTKGEARIIIRIGANRVAKSNASVNIRIATTTPKIYQFLLNKAYNYPVQLLFPPYAIQVRAFSINVVVDDFFTT
jgi:hypothetical protein